MEIRTAFGITIKNLRNDKKLSQEDLAFLSGLDVSFISLVENGKKQPTLMSIAKIAKGFDLKISEVIIEMERLELKSSF